MITLKINNAEYNLVEHKDLEKLKDVLKKDDSDLFDKFIRELK